MTDLPEPFTPADCDLRGLPFMPLDVVRLCDSDLVAISSGDEFKAAVMLWAKAWLQIPAASLPDDPRVLAHLSGAGTRWAKVAAVALRGWVKCADGRLYHAVIAEKAREAWAFRVLQRERSKRANAKRWGSREDGAVHATGEATGMPGASQKDAREHPGGDPHGDARGDPKGQGQGQEPSLRSGRGGRGLGPAEAPPDARTTLFRDGLDRMRRLVGCGESRARGLIGSMLGDLGDDAAAANLILTKAEAERPADPVPWLRRACEAHARGSPRRQPQGGGDRGAAWMMDPDAFERTVQ